MIRKNVKKLISIFVLTIFVMSALSCNVMASLSYGKKWGDGLPWTGDDTPLAQAVASDGTSLSTAYTGDSKTHPVIESRPGTFGKEKSDEIYKTYDLSTRKSVSQEGSGFIVDSGTDYETKTKTKDSVLSFSFAYDKAGTDYLDSANAKGTLVHSYARTMKYGQSGNYTGIYNPIVIRDDGIKFCDESYASLTATTADSCFISYNFEPHKWYNVDFVFDFENKNVDSDAYLQTEYIWSVYVNGVRLGGNKVTGSYYAFKDGWLRWFPAIGAEMYWDNLNFQIIDDAGAFSPAIARAAISSSDSAVVVAGDLIKIDNPDLTIDAVKSAISTSLKENETLRIYNSDYSTELTSDSSASAIGAKLVVAGTQALTSSVTKENIYTYYDIGIDGYLFEEPSISIDNNIAVGNVKLYNYTGEKKEFKVYLAVYNNKELIALNVTNVDLVADEDETFVDFTTPEASFTAGNEVKLFVWESDGITPELISKYAD